MIFLIENVWILIQVILKFLHDDPIVNKSVLGCGSGSGLVSNIWQIGDKPMPKPIMIKLYKNLWHYWVQCFDFKMNPNTIKSALVWPNQPDFLAPGHITGADKKNLIKWKWQASISFLTANGPIKRITFIVKGSTTYCSKFWNIDIISMCFLFQTRFSKMNKMVSSNKLHLK